MEQARAYSARRQGSISFAVIDQRGGYRGHRSRQAVPAASVFKAMLLVAYLRRGDVRGRPLRTGDRRLLAPMIRRSDNAAASRIVLGLGPRRIYRLASRAGMRRFRLRSPWGLSEITARDQVRFFHRLETLVPTRHRPYARTLLHTVVPRQRWGVARARPRGWRLYFKGGWASGTGRVCHQVAFLERGGRRVSLAIMVEHSPSHRYATETLRGVARRLLRGL